MLICDKLVLQQDDFRLTADVTFGAGKITALIGPSGAGKSTLLAALSGFLEPAAGRVLWQDTDLTALAPGARPISAVFQDNNLFPHLNIAQNAGLGLRPSLRLTADERAAVERALSSVGLEGLGSRKPAALSGGQQSRAALARVLLADRPVVLLDEPFAALGPAMKDDMLDLVRATLGAGGRSVLMVTHDPDDARRIADEASLVADGIVTAPVTVSAFFDRPSEALAAYLG
ncbi:MULTISPECIES: ATP-binding cassette domain-containing protein [unclassified Yoonia]|uniref:thiamine ABC transporter ATP-binding protein n=1 Tax=unclassified Yoonia TaxID=2629118 RepID=UPI002AFFA1F5|nr:MULTISPECIES: ATP-binding cassette domain-containing protein [unclassified Yoonia]